MLEYRNYGILEADANMMFTFSASGIVQILRCIFSGLQNNGFSLLSLFQSSIIPIFHGMTVTRNLSALGHLDGLKVCLDVRPLQFGGRQAQIRGQGEGPALQITNKPASFVPFQQ